MKLTEALHKFIYHIRLNGWRAAVRKSFFFMQRTLFKARPHASLFQPVCWEPQDNTPISQPSVQLLAFYLPQFHCFPENDAWWGKGFTEWTNVNNAKPLYPGHVQPDVPGTLGYYTLDNPRILHEQVKMARHHGISGFCFHYYWFSGKRLMEKPLDIFLSDPSLDMPFCLNWANENWTRRWDGLDSEVLISQKHCPEDDRAVITDVMRYFHDPRYIRIEGRPVFLVYHAALLPDMAATLQRWKETCLAAGEAAPYFVMVQSFGNENPDIYGFDAAVQFPPHAPHHPKNHTALTVEGFYDGFAGMCASFEEMADIAARGLQLHKTQSPLFPTVCPAWDNTPRRGARALMFAGSTPERYAAWLTKAGQYALHMLPADRRFVFVNAWNEWAEGAHLEPNKAHGYAWLNATSRTLRALNGQTSTWEKSIPPSHQCTILFVGHDAALAGSQILLLALLRWLRTHTAIDCRLLLCGSGLLEESYSRYVPVLCCPPDQLDLETVRGFCQGDPDLIYGNTSVAAQAYPLLSGLNVPIVTHVHELEKSLQKFAGPTLLDNMKRYSQHYIAASEPVRSNLIAQHGIAPAAVKTVDAFIDLGRTPLDAPQKALVRRSLGLPENGLLVLACGSLDARKAPDLFIECAAYILKHSTQPVHFCWVGGGDDPSIRNPQALAREYGIATSISFVDECLQPAPYFQAADIFLLPSREDPFPLVCLEAAECAMPILCFADAGGMPLFVDAHPQHSDSVEHLRAGFVLPYLDTTAMGAQALLLVEDANLRENIGQQARTKLLQSHTSDVAVPQILHYCRALCGRPAPVSVIVPNFNYARYLELRLASIYEQSFRDIELIVLDDASTDNSMDMLNALPSWKKEGLQIIHNERNSGNVFAQWARGIEHAHGAFVWMAEADDSANPDFLERMLMPMRAPETLLVYSIPQVIDAEGVLQDFDYRHSYLRFASDDRWRADFTSGGREEIRQGLGIVNCIPNVSATLFRLFNKGVLLEYLREAQKYPCSGDWLFYLRLAACGNVAYVHGLFAQHRRHEGSIIGQTESRAREKRAVLKRELIEIHALARPLVAPTELFDRQQARVQNELIPDD